MLSQHLNKTLKMLALCTGLISTSHFAQANDFATHPDYVNFKQNDERLWVKWRSS